MKNTSIRLVVSMFFGFCLLLLVCVKVTHDRAPGFLVCLDGKELHTCYSSHDGIVYLYLPSYISEGRVTLPAEENIEIDGSIVQGNQIVDYLDGNEHMLKMFGKEYPFIVLRGAESVGTIFIDTETGGLKRLHADKENDEKIEMIVVDGNGNEDYSSGINMDKISGHGNSTWSLNDKKSYTISLANATDILAMGMSDKFVLIANCIDVTNLRNKISYDLIKNSCRSVWAPNSRYVDLYINGNYWGLYLLCQKPTIYNLGFSEPETLVELAGQRICKIDSNFLDDGLLADVNKRIEEIDNALTGEPESKWFDIIDKDSWVEKYLIDEILLNNDASLGSQYYHFTDDSKVYAGPAWDYDNIWGGKLLA